MKITKAGMLSVFFPPRCPVCDEVLLPGQDICGDCSGQGCGKKIMRIREPVCKKCGKPLSDERREYCGDCSGRKQHFYTQGKAVFVFEGAIRGSMYRFKYGGRQEYAAFYAKAAAEQYGAWLKRNGVEAIVPVPMYFRKKRRRGYNQAEVFAKALGRELHMPVDCGMVKRIRNTVPQKELNREEKAHNVKNAFQFAADIVKYKKIVLVDDIYTTGSTMDAVAEVLLAAGVREIYYICISIGEGY